MMKDLKGKRVTPSLIHETADKIASHLPAGFFFTELEVKDIRQEGDRLIATVGRKEEFDG